MRAALFAFALAVSSALVSIGAAAAPQAVRAICFYVGVLGFFGCGARLLIALLGKSRPHLTKKERVQSQMEQNAPTTEGGTVYVKLTPSAF